MIRIASVLVAFTIVASAFAQGEVTGKWTGKLFVFHPTDKKVKPAPVPSPQGDVKYVLTLKADGTYTTVITGAPDKKTHTADGTWKRSGQNAILSVLKRDGKPDTSEPRNRTLVMSADGKSMSTEMKPIVQARGPKGETKLPKGVVIPKIMLVFTRSK